MQFSQAPLEEQKLRRRFIKYFVERDLFSMVCPIDAKTEDASRLVKHLSGVANEKID